LPHRAKHGPYFRRGTFVDITNAEPDDAEAIHLIKSGPRAVRGTLQLPPAEKRRRWLREISEGTHVLGAR
jgi:hypothetical protein